MGSDIHIVWEIPSIVRWEDDHQDSRCHHVPQETGMFPICRLHHHQGVLSAIGQGPKEGVRHLLVLFVRFRVLLNLNPARYKDEAVKNPGNQIILILLDGMFQGFGMSRKFLTHHWGYRAKKRTYTKRMWPNLGMGPLQSKSFNKTRFSGFFRYSWPYRTSMSAHVAGIFRQRNWCDMFFKSLKSEKLKTPP